MRLPSNMSYLALKIGYINKTHTHTQSGAENSLFQFWLTITKAFSPFHLEETTNYWSLSAWWAYGLVTSRAVSQYYYFCPSKNKWLKSSGEEMNWTDHQVFGCCPVLPRGIHERNPLSPSFYGFWSWIVKKWNCMDRNAFFLIFRVTTAIHNTLLYHFFTYN